MEPLSSVSLNLCPNLCPHLPKIVPLLGNTPYLPKSTWIGGLPFSHRLFDDHRKVPSNTGYTPDATTQVDAAGRDANVRDIVDHS